MKYPLFVILKLITVFHSISYADELDNDELVTPEYAVECEPTVDWRKIDGMPKVDETIAEKYIGKLVVINIGLKNDKNVVVGYTTVAGIIKTYSNKEGIQVDLFDSDETAFIPPGLKFIYREGGTLNLPRGNKVKKIEDPFFLACWICIPPTTQK